MYSTTSKGVTSSSIMEMDVLYKIKNIEKCQTCTLAVFEKSGSIISCVVIYTCERKM